MSRLARTDRDVLIGVGMLATVAAIIALGLSGILNGLFDSTSTREVRAQFRDGQQLRVGDQVRIQGVQAGKVTAISLDPDGRAETVTMQVPKDAGRLYGDARAVLRWKNILGGSFYVDLQRGSAVHGPLASTIPVSRTERQTELEDLVGVFRGGAVSGLRTLPGEMANAFQDHHAPTRLFDTVARVAPDAQAGLRALRGSDLDRDLRGLVSETARTTKALAAPASDLRAVVAGAAATLSTTAAREADLRAVLSTAPATQAAMVQTLTRLQTTLGLANPLLRDLRAPAGEVAPTLARLQPTVASGARLVRRAVPLLRSLRPAVSGLADAAHHGLPLVEGLTPSLGRLVHTILPYLLEKDPGTTKSTAVMIGGTFTGLGSGAAGQEDENGHFIRFPATSGNSSFNSLPCQTYISNPDAAQIAACNTLQDSLKAFLDYNALGPTPGTDPGDGSGGGG